MRSLYLSAAFGARHEDRREGNAEQDEVCKQHPRIEPDVFDEAGKGDADKRGRAGDEHRSGKTAGAPSSYDAVLYAAQGVPHERHKAEYAGLEYELEILRLRMHRAVDDGVSAI